MGCQRPGSGLPQHRHYADARANLDDSLRLLARVGDIYARADDANRRLCNQALFTAIYIDEDNDIRVGYRSPYDGLANTDLRRRRPDLGRPGTKTGPGRNPDQGWSLGEEFTPDPSGVSNGTRTRDILDHNQVLYQLSYTHHAHPHRGANSVDHPNAPTAPARNRGCCPRPGPAPPPRVRRPTDQRVAGTVAPVIAPWCRSAMAFSSGFDRPGGGRKTASR